MDDQPNPMPPDPFRVPATAEATHALVLEKNIEMAERNDARAQAYNEGQVELLFAHAILRYAAAFCMVCLTALAYIVAFRIT